MRGKYSKEKFFRKNPQIIQTYFQGTESNNPEDIIKLLNIILLKKNLKQMKLIKKIYQYL